MHRQECFAYLDSAAESLPNAERLASEALSIPIYPELQRSQQDEVIAAIESVMARPSAEGDRAHGSPGDSGQPRAGG